MFFLESIVYDELFAQDRIEHVVSCDSSLKQDYNLETDIEALSKIGVMIMFPTDESLLNKRARAGKHDLLLYINRNYVFSQR